ncbi:hypothetical protein JN11_00515 [Mucilaginibacter frigoritolerans]|uniref:Uncharacterized protein n=1 Tax=Mucilaginibacter frigoritolerans TaxID=652788 RepID=A0A562UG59_9SPHI|nr:hypothetical protein [Mucilaginibacter frigoritolerans]TWJ04794.1 hypothetical protein JN11_00515 [Mucilaginibacter frigoritolerans]
MAHIYRKIHFFGTTIRETIKVLSTDEELSLEPFDKSIKGKSTLKRARRSTYSHEDKTRVVMRIIVTFILLAISFYLLIEKNEQSKTLPCSIISAITGYWLK